MSLSSRSGAYATAVARAIEPVRCMDRVGFGREEDAQRFYSELEERLRKFELELAAAVRHGDGGAAGRASVVITNYPEGQVENLELPCPPKEDMGVRALVGSAAVSGVACAPRAATPTD